jgi:hypothetical protein
MTKRQTKPKPGRSAGPLDSTASHSAEVHSAGLHSAAYHRDGAAEASNLLALEAKEITRTLVRRAIDGNMKALRLCIERLVPFSRERVLPVKIPAAQDALQITIALQAVFEGLGAGYLTAGEAQKLAALLENQRKAIETNDLEARLQALESVPAGSRDANPDPVFDAAFQAALDTPFHPPLQHDDLDE